MTRQRLPIGIQDFRHLRETGSYYTAPIRQLVEQGDHYFLSRPRRFGKSLLLDTLSALFEEHESLFRRLEIHSHWSWSAPHPVLRLSFGGKYNEPGEIEGDIIKQLEGVEREHDLAPAWTSDTGPRRFRNLLDRLHAATGRPVVVLVDEVDEYDKPILDVLHDPELARANRDYLRGFYGIVKDSARHVRFVFVTGVSMFSKISLFSGLNNLKDISLDPRYATLCGYREEDQARRQPPHPPQLAAPACESGWPEQPGACGNRALADPPACACAQPWPAPPASVGACLQGKRPCRYPASRHRRAGVLANGACATPGSRPTCAGRHAPAPAPRDEGAPDGP